MTYRACKNVDMHLQSERRLLAFYTLQSVDVQEKKDTILDLQCVFITIAQSIQFKSRIVILPRKANIIEKCEMYEKKCK